MGTSEARRGAAAGAPFVLPARQRIGLTRPVELLLATTSGAPRYATDPVLFNAASSDSSTHSRASPVLFSATAARVLRTDSPRGAMFPLTLR